MQQIKDEMGGLPAPILLVCPTSVVTNWRLESEKFTPDLSTLVHQGADRLRGEDFVTTAQEADMVLTSYALVRRDADAMRQVNWLARGAG